MILADHEIRALCDRGLVEPFNPDNIEPASIDVTLGHEFRVFKEHRMEVVDLDGPHDTTISKSGVIQIMPGEMCLGHTLERVRIPDDLVARIEGKSSIGRLGLSVHVTAGFIDPGFFGQITLEMVNMSPNAIILRPGKLIAQLSFHKMNCPAKQPYDGRYQGDMGSVASRYGQ